LGSPGESYSEASLIHDIQSGTPEQAATAFEELVKRHGSRLFLHLSAKGLTKHEQEDVASETWGRACRLIGHYQYRGVSFFAWLRAIADRVAKEYCKRRYVGESLEASEQDVAAPPSDDDPEPATLDRLTDEERMAVVREGLAEAPDDYRAVIEALFFDEFTTKEVMELYEWSQSKVYTTKFRALARLKQRLLDRYGTDTIQDWLS
jgi:RNA polymerase sigma factor (sigma-70 family)